MPQVGERLRQERERKNLTLKDVENALNIRTAYLQAIEEDRFEVIPGEVYVKGFIRNYGNFLGLDGSQLVAMYREARQAEAAPPQEAAVPPVPPSAAAPARRLSYGGWLWKAAGALLVVAVAIWYFYAAAPPPQPVPQPSPPPASGTAQPAPAPAARPTPTAQQVPSSPVAAGVQVTAKFSDDCWLAVTADGKTVYEGTATKNATMTWQGRDDIKITFGNAGAAEVTVNGRSLGVQGPPGEVVKKTFSANNIKP